jgi:ribosomal protein S18 acetylase RimI-like enzyme
MNKIFTDLSEDALNRVSVEHYFDSFKCFSVVPGVEVYEGDDMLRVASPGVPNWLTNTVLHCQLSDGTVDTVIDETLEYFSSRGVKPYWRVCPGDAPADLEQRLLNKGFSLAGEEPSMAVDLENLKQDLKTPDGLVIQRLTNAAAMQEKHGWISTFGEGRNLGSLLLNMFSAYGFDPDSDWQHYLGVQDWKPVSWASVFYATGVAGIYAVGTQPEARRQGIGSAVTSRALLEARKRGYRVGVLQSSTMGYNVYRNLGFETCFTIKTYAPADPHT